MSVRTIALGLALLLSILAPAGNALCSRASHPFAGIVATSDRVIVVWNSHSPDLASRMSAFGLKTGRLLWQQTKPRVPAVAPLATSSGLVCVSSGSGVYVRDVRTGVLKAHLEPRRGVQAFTFTCASGAILTATRDAQWTVYLDAFDTTSYHLLWTQVFPRSDVWEVTPTGNAYAVLLSDPWGMAIGKSPRNFRGITLSAKDRTIISTKRGKQPDGSPPTYLPKAVREWLTALLLMDGQGFVPRTKIEYIDGNWLVGNRDCTVTRYPLPGRLFAVRGDTAKVVWQRDVPGLSEICLHRGVLFIAAFDRAVGDSRNSTRSDLTAVDPKTGRVLWTRDVED